MNTGSAGFTVPNDDDLTESRSKSSSCFVAVNNGAGDGFAGVEEAGIVAADFTAVEDADVAATDFTAVEEADVAGADFAVKDVGRVAFGSFLMVSWNASIQMNTKGAPSPILVKAK